MTQSEIERERYEARRKAQMDHEWILRSVKEEGAAMRAQGLAEGRAKGRAEGLTEGRTVGEKTGIIQFCERLLNRPVTPAEQLETLPLAELTRLAEELQQAVQSR